MNEPQKLIKGILSQAEIAGASVFVGTEACELRTHGNNVTGLHVRNERNQANTTINGHVVIDTTGRSENRLGEKLEGYSPRPLQWARGVNMLISRRIFGDYAIGLKHSDNVTDRESRLRGSDRNLFFVPRKDGTAIGTFYEHEKTVDGSLEISAQQCERYIDMVNSALPRDVIKAAEITGWNSGWLPVDEKSTPEQMNFIKSGSIRTIDVDGSFTGLIEVRSVKFTTAPAVARDVISLLATVGGFKLEQR
jgi:glycerol-3-phosphate dehydrogenase